MMTAVKVVRVRYSRLHIVIGMARRDVRHVGYLTHHVFDEISGSLSWGARHDEAHLTGNKHETHPL